MEVQSFVLSMAINNYNVVQINPEVNTEQVSWDGNEDRGESTLLAATRLRIYRALEGAENSISELSPAGTAELSPGR